MADSEIPEGECRDDRDQGATGRHPPPVHDVPHSVHRDEAQRHYGARHSQHNGPHLGPGDLTDIDLNVRRVTGSGKPSQEPEMTSGLIYELSQLKYPDLPTSIIGTILSPAAAAINTQWLRSATENRAIDVFLPNFLPRIPEIIPPGMAPIPNILAIIYKP